MTPKKSSKSSTLVPGSAVKEQSHSPKQPKQPKEAREAKEPKQTSPKTQHTLHHHANEVSLDTLVMDDVEAIMIIRLTASKYYDKARTDLNHPNIDGQTKESIKLSLLHAQATVQSIYLICKFQLWIWYCDQEMSEEEKARRKRRMFEELGREVELEFEALGLWAGVRGWGGG
ncbi:hypothetical protein BDQ17DRAFT_1425523 [Cyathus striatus]|nr:hypothetical protein BDQ17DRAFT_1425523 [Cyathus striatus]